MCHPYGARLFREYFPGLASWATNFRTYGAVRRMKYRLAAPPNDLRQLLGGFAVSLSRRRAKKYPALLATFFDAVSARIQVCQCDFGLDIALLHCRPKEARRGCAASGSLLIIQVTLRRGKVLSAGGGGFG